MVGLDLSCRQQLIWIDVALALFIGPDVSANQCGTVPMHKCKHHGWTMRLIDLEATARIVLGFD